MKHSFLKSQTSVKKWGCAVLVSLLLFAPMTFASEQSCIYILKKLAKTWKSSLVQVPWHRLMYFPGKTLATYPGVEIAGFVNNPQAYREVVGHLAQKMQAFDQYMLDLGFDQVPESGRFVLFDKKPWRERLQGIYLLNRPVFNLWKGKLQTVVVVDPYSPQMDSLLRTLEDESVVLHERTHHFLLRNYGRGAFVNLHSMIKEALADFFPLHKADTPRLGMNVYSEGKPIRDIEQRVGYDKTKTLRVQANLESYGKLGIPHDSMLFSNALWEARQVFGATALSELLKPFVDNLNLYRASFVALVDLAKGMDYERKIVAELEYFLAILKRTAVDNGGDEWAAKADLAIAKLAGELQLRPDRIDAVSQAILKNRDGQSYDWATEMKGGIILSALATASLAREGLFLTAMAASPFALGYAFYFIYQKIFPEDSN